MKPNMNRIKAVNSKKILIGLVFISIITIVVSLFLTQQIGNANKTNKVKIKAFSVGNSWENPGGLEVTLPFNITLQNIGTNDLQGLKIGVEMFENGSSVRSGTFFGEHEQFNGTLHVGEAREIKGLIGTTIEATSIMFPIGGTSETFAYSAKVILNGVVLDECWATTNR
jgi:hypothetical protein